MPTRRHRHQGHVPFDADVAAIGSYQYTQRHILSAQTANERLTLVTLRWFKSLPKQKAVMDLGCGDGAYTAELAAALPKTKFYGTDPATQAIKEAQRRYPHISFSVSDLLRADTLPKVKVATSIVRGVIHHLEQPALGVKNAVLFADHTLIIEPNGWNPIVKILEKLSPYHREHKEQSFTSSQLRGWVEAAGAEVTREYYVGLVPFFCPAWAVPFLKWLEPIIEHSILARWLCGQVILEVKR